MDEPNFLVKNIYSDVIYSNIRALQSRVISSIIVIGHDDSWPQTNCNKRVENKTQPNAIENFTILIILFFPRQQKGSSPANVIIRTSTYIRIHTHTERERERDNERNRTISRVLLYMVSNREDWSGALVFSFSLSIQNWKRATFPEDRHHQTSLAAWHLPKWMNRPLPEAVKSPWARPSPFARRPLAT